MFPFRGRGAVADTLYVEDVFSAFTYTGNGAARSIVNGIDLAGEGGLVWFKARSSASDSAWYDTERGATFDLVSSSTAAQTTQATGLTAFNFNGFDIGTLGKINQSARTIVAWTFRKSFKFFDVVDYIGDGVAGRTVSHNLGVVPGFIVVKRVDALNSWAAQHRSLTGTAHIFFSSTTPSVTSNAMWNNTDPTSSVFTLGSNAAVNASGGVYVAYIFAHDTSSDGIIQCGSFAGSASAVNVNLGWEPQFLFIKNITTTGTGWVMVDSSRSAGADASIGSSYLYANATSAEGSATGVYVTPTGFGVTGGITEINAASNNYIYMAVRKGLMRTPTDPTKVFAINASQGTQSARTISGISVVAPDTILTKGRDYSSGYPAFFDRVRGSFGLRTPLSSIEGSNVDTITSYNMDGITMGVDAADYLNRNLINYIYYFIKQARGFYDRVPYTGTFSAHTEQHNLGVSPELILTKSRAGVADWCAYCKYLPSSASQYLIPNLTNAVATSTDVWNNTDPTDSVFSVGASNLANRSGERHIAYLFASCPGVSKVGTYNGSFSVTTVDCGFTSGARFVMIKMIDSTSDWYVWDTTRGIVSGNDPYFRLNSGAVDVTASDLIDSNSVGFELPGGAATNTFGREYIYLAIA